MSSQQTTARKIEEPDAVEHVQQYMLSGEEVSYTIRFRQTGLINWLRSLLGYGVTYWILTDRRLIQQTNVGGGFEFEFVPLEKITSVGYRSQLPIYLLGTGLILTFFGLFTLGIEPGIGMILLVPGIILLLYAWTKRRQGLVITASGGVEFTLSISQGEQVDDFLSYINRELDKGQGELN